MTNYCGLVPDQRVHWSGFQSALTPAAAAVAETTCRCHGDDSAMEMTARLHMGCGSDSSTVESERRQQQTSDHLHRRVLPCIGKCSSVLYSPPTNLTPVECMLRDHSHIANATVLHLWATHEGHTFRPQQTRSLSYCMRWILILTTNWYWQRLSNYSR